jgi:hypothetical protein
MRVTAQISPFAYHFFFWQVNSLKHVCVRVFVTEVNNLGLLVRRDRIDPL